jgi:hypothetical protein
MKPGSNLLDSIYEYNQNQISIEFIGLWFNNPAVVTYRYRLLGYSDQWITTRLNYYHQVIIGRKFSESFSLQFMPTVVHRNLVETENDLHDTKSIGVGSRIKLSRRIAVTAEYFYSIDKLPAGKTEPLSIGFDIETGGHVFQLHFTNALGMNERAFLMDTDGKWDKGDIHFGFNISRVFTLAKPKSFRKSQQNN